MRYSSMCPTPITHLHETLLHVGGKIPEDTQLRLQGPRHSTHREGEVLCAGGVVVHGPGGEETRGQREPVADARPPETPGHPSAGAHTCWAQWPRYQANQKSTYFLLAERAMCVPLLKSTATRRLDS